MVADNGIGTEIKYFSVIFMLPKRLYNAKEYSGNGLRIALCRGIIEQYRGTIKAESKPGKGSAFSFTIQKKKL